MLAVRTRRIRRPALLAGLLASLLLLVLAAAGPAQARILDAPLREIGVDEFAITPSIVGDVGGSIDPAGETIVPIDGEQTFTFTPDMGYHVEDVRVDGESVGSPTSYTFQNVQANHTISVEFALDTFTITPSVVGGSGGSISPDTPQTVDYEGSQQFTFAPAAGYHVDDVRVDGVSVGSPTSYTFQNVEANHTISVEFALDTFTITPSVVGGASGHGAISPDTPQTVDYDGSRQFTFTPDTGYHVEDVRVDGESVGSPSSYTFQNVRANHMISVEFAVDTFTITPSVVGGEGGSISPSTPQTVDYDGSRQFTFAPADGYHVEDVRVDGESVGAPTSYTFQNVQANHTISVEFALDTFTITPSVVGGSGGSISPSTPQTVDYGGSQQFTFTPDSGYHVADVRVDGESVGSPASYTFQNVQANHAISVEFALDTFTITSSVVGGASGHGTISPDTPQTVDYDGSRQFTFTPDTGYHVEDVLVDGESVGAPASYTFQDVRANHTISVEFAVDTFTITPSVVGGVGGSISPSTPQTVAYGATPTFTFTPDMGYHVDDVLVDGESVGAPASYTFQNVQANHTISVEFAVDTFTITPSVVGGASGHGSISPSTPQTVDYDGSRQFTFTPETGYHVEDVRVDGESVGAPARYTFQEVRTNHTISVEFALDTFTITPSVVGGASGHGSISPSTPQTVDYGGSRQFTFTPETGYHVDDVRVDGESVGAPSSYTFEDVRANHTISVEFAVDTFTITPSVVGGASGHGAISPSTPQTVTYGATPTFTFTPETGYHIAEVLVDGDPVALTGPDGYTFPDVSANHTISVEFAVDTFTITPSVVGGASGHGSISPNTPQTVAYGGEATFTFIPDASYRVMDVLVDGVSQGAVPSYRFDDVTADHTISVSFAYALRTRVVMDLSAATVGWGKAVRLTGSVLQDDGSPLSGGSVAVLGKARLGDAWETLETLTPSSDPGSEGQVSTTTRPEGRTYYALLYTPEEHGPYAGSMSSIQSVKVRPLLGKPSRPSRAKANRRFKVSGKLTPHFTKGSKTVEVRAYRQTKRGWVLAKKAKATNADRAGGSTYAATFKLKIRGTYRFRAFTAATPQFAATSSAYSSKMRLR